MKKTVGLLSPPTVFVVFELPCAEMKIDCHGGADKGRFGLLTGNRFSRVCGQACGLVC